MRNTSIAFSLLLAALWATAPRAGVLAQHETASDLLDGERAFKQNCANCHGPDGDQIQGIDLGRGRFRRPMTDADLVGIIRNGIPNTPMPASATMTVAQAQQIVAYLRSRAATSAVASVTGDAARGRAIVTGKGDCTSCHRVEGSGSRVGPDLSSIGAQRQAAELQRALIDPNADVQPQNRFYRVTLKDGSTVEGRLLGHDTFNLQLLDTKEQLRSFNKTDIRSGAFLPSPMPSYRTTLTPQEIADVVTYLSSLRNR